MHRVIGYKDGRAIWSESVPANPGSMPIRGSLVVGAPGPNDLQRRRDAQRKHVAKVKAEGEAS